MDPAQLEQSDDLVPLIEALVGSAPVCSACLAFRLRRSPAQVYGALQRMAETVRLQTDVGRCQRCLRDTVIHSVA